MWEYWVDRELGKRISVSKWVFLILGDFGAAYHPLCTVYCECVCVHMCVCPDWIQLWVTDNWNNRSLNKLEVSVFYDFKSGPLKWSRAGIVFFKQGCKFLTLLLFISASLCPFSLNQGRLVIALTNKEGRVTSSDLCVSVVKGHGVGTLALGALSCVRCKKPNYLSCWKGHMWVLLFRVLADPFSCPCQDARHLSEAVLDPPSQARHQLKVTTR